MKKIILYLLSYVLILIPYFVVDMEVIFLFLYLITIPVSFVLSVVIHELGHYYYGKKTGYEFVSFRVLWLLIYKDNNKTKIKFEKIPTGIMGQCVMTPTNDEYVLYNKGGWIFNLYACLIYTVLSILSLIFFREVLLALTFGLSMNIVLYAANSCLSKMPNDALNLKSIQENEESLVYFKEQLNVLKEYSNQNFDIKEYLFTPIDNYLIASCNFIYSNILFSFVHNLLNGKSKEFIDKIDFDYDEVVVSNSVTFNVIVCLKFIQLVLVENDIEEAKLFYFQKFKYTRIFEKLTVGYQFDLYKLALAVLFKRESSYCDKLVKKIKNSKYSYKFEKQYIDYILEKYEEIKQVNEYVNKKLKYALVFDVQDNFGKIALMKNKKVMYKECYVNTEEENFAGYNLFNIKNDDKEVYVAGNTVLTKEEKTEITNKIKNR